MIPIEKNKQCMLLTLAVIFLSTTLLQPIHGYSILPVKYHLCMMNELSRDPLFLRCYSVQRQKAGSNSGNSGELVIPAHNSYNWSFHPYVVGDLAYYCNAEWGVGHYATLFEAFMDTPEFVDGGCGGRHCIWKYVDDGLYLYNIASREFKFMYAWKNHRVV